MKITTLTKVCLLSLLSSIPSAVSCADEPLVGKADVEVTFSVVAANLPSINGTFGRVERMFGRIYSNFDIGIRHPNRDDFFFFCPPLLASEVTVKNVSTKVVYWLRRVANPFDFGLLDADGTIHPLHAAPLTDRQSGYVIAIQPGHDYETIGPLATEEIEAIRNHKLVAGIYLTSRPATEGYTTATPLALVWSNPVSKVPPLPSKYWDIPPATLFLVLFDSFSIGAWIVVKKLLRNRSKISTLENEDGKARSS